MYATIDSTSNKQELFKMKSKITHELTLADFHANHAGEIKSKNYLVDDKEALDLQKVQSVLDTLNTTKGVLLESILSELRSLKTITSNKRKIYVKNTDTGLTAFISAVSKKSFSEHKIPDIAAVYAVEWEESERGWGCRPDGYSFHASLEKAQAYINMHYSTHTGPVPDEYSRSVGSPRLVEVSPSLYLAVMQKGNIRLWENSLSLFKTYDATK